jgi:gamma-glutamylcyclotransferase (GGCT)/AIG2-like uncharacterized protein YtfP
MPTHSLFAYGTLRDPDVLALVLGRRLDASWLRPALAPGYTLVAFPGRTYPAIRRDATAVAPGTLVGGLSASDLAALDRFEGPEYARGSIAVSVDNQAETADVYWPQVAVGAAPLWRLEDWIARYKPAFMAAEAGDIAAWRQRLRELGDEGRR